MSTRRDILEEDLEHLAHGDIDGSHSLVVVFVDFPQRIHGLEGHSDSCALIVRNHSRGAGNLTYLELQDAPLPFSDQSQLLLQVDG